MENLLFDSKGSEGSIVWYLKWPSEQKNEFMAKYANTFPLNMLFKCHAMVRICQMQMLVWSDESLKI